MFHRNENVDSPSTSIETNLPLATDDLMSNNEQQLDQEAAMTPSSPSPPPLTTPKQEPMLPFRKRKFNELNNDSGRQRQQTVKHRCDNYEDLSNDEIKERLLKSIINEIHVRNNVEHWFETDRTLLHFTRQHASLLAKYTLLKLELELYQNSVNLTESVLPWLSSMSKALLARNNINEQFFRIQKYLTRQCKSTEEAFRDIAEKLTQSISIQQQQQLSKSSTVDMNLLVSVIVMFVRQDQQEYNIELIKKRHLLMLNARDIRLLYEFYHLQPNGPQLEIADYIWQATIDEQQTKTSRQSHQDHLSKHVNYGHIIADQKKIFLALHEKRQQEDKDGLSKNYLKLNTDLLMNIIESRQKVLIQRLEFDSDFQQTFRMNDEDEHDQANNVDKIHHDGEQQQQH